MLEELGELFDRLSVDVEDAATAFAQSVRLMLRLCRSRRRFPRCSSGRGCTTWSPEGGVGACCATSRAGVASGRFLKAEPPLARAAVSGAVLATLQMSLTNPELVDDAACDQLVEQLLRMLGVPFDAACELAHARCRSRRCLNPADLRDPSAHTGPQPTLGPVRPPPSSPWGGGGGRDVVQRGSASLRRSAEEEGGEMGGWSCLSWCTGSSSAQSRRAVDQVPAAGWWRVTHRRRADPTTQTRRTGSFDDRPRPVG